MELAFEALGASRAAGALANCRNSQPVAHIAAEQSLDLGYSADKHKHVSGNAYLPAPSLTTKRTREAWFKNMMAIENILNTPSPDPAMTQEQDDDLYVCLRGGALTPEAKQGKDHSCTTSPVSDHDKVEADSDSGSRESTSNDGTNVHESQIPWISIESNDDWVKLLLRFCTTATIQVIWLCPASAVDTMAEDVTIPHVVLDLFKALLPEYPDTKYNPYIVVPVIVFLGRDLELSQIGE